jgi:hypothetical protein
VIRKVSSGLWQKGDSDFVKGLSFGKQQSSTAVGNLIPDMEKEVGDAITFCHTRINLQIICYPFFISLSNL